MGNKTLTLRKFDMSRITCDRNIVMLARRGSGKSVLVKDLLWHKRDIPVGAVISPTEQCNRYFGKFVPDLFIHEKYTPKLLEMVVKRQQMVIQQKAEEQRAFGHSRIDERAFLVMDDCLHSAKGSNGWTKDENMNFICYNGRHIKLLYILTVQYVVGIPPAMRSNSDFIFILREPILQNRRKIYEAFAGMFPTLQMFCDVLDQTTENFECLVIDNTSRSNKLEDVFFYYKAVDHENFRIGSDQYWQADESYRRDTAHDNEDEEYDPLDQQRRGSAPLITVRKV
jgi:hypothetical protein